MPGVSEAAQPAGLLGERHARNFTLLLEWAARSSAFGAVLAILLFMPAWIGLAIAGVDLTVAVGTAVFVGFFLALTLLGALLYRELWRQVGARVLIFPDRLVHVHGKQSDTYAWEDIEEFFCWGVDEYVSTLVLDRRLVESRYHYRFRHKDGHQFVFSERFGGAGGEPLACHVEKGLIERRLPALRKRFLDNHEAIPFGPFSLEPEGLRYRRSVLPWSQVNYVWAQDGKIRVSKRDKVFDWCSAKMETVPNGCLLLALAKDRVEREEASA